MPKNPRPLQVVVVSQQISLLHEVSWTLEAVGIKAQTTTDFDQDALWRRFSTADFVILDGRGISDPSSATLTHNSNNPTFRIFLYDPKAQTDLAAWYAAGAHDGLRTPVSRGELLTRVRAGARYLEFERRSQRQSARSIVPGMYSRRGFLQKLRKLSTNMKQDAAQHSLLLTAIDWYAGIRRGDGENAVDMTVNSVARSIKRVAGESSFSAYLGNGQFATLLMGPSLASAKGVAESLAKDFVSRDSHRESIPRTTLTSAVAPWSAEDAVRSFNDALEALEVAQQSGSGSVIQHDEFAHELNTWKQEMTTGNPFASVIAQDIMEVFPALLDCENEQPELEEAFVRAGIRVRPYVDRDGRLIGVMTQAESGADTSGDASAGAIHTKLAMPETIVYDATFPDIYEAFSSRGCDMLVVTANDRPLGYVAFDGFLSMIDPIDAESYSGPDEPSDELAYLIVPPSHDRSEAPEPVKV
jgi:GGDEF domain-containing protein